MDAVALLDHVSETISPKCGTTSVASTRLADVILTRLDLEDARQLPDSLLSFVNDILVSSYPPELENKPVSMWLIRSLTRVVDACPNELLLDMLESLKDGFCTWLTDRQKVMTREEYSFNVSPSYESEPVLMLTVERRFCPCTKPCSQASKPSPSQRICSMLYVEFSKRHSAAIAAMLLRRLTLSGDSGRLPSQPFQSR
jgi:hypothetical protein